MEASSAKNVARCVVKLRCWSSGRPRARATDTARATELERGTSAGGAGAVRGHRQPTMSNGVRPLRSVACAHARRACGSACLMSCRSASQFAAALQLCTTNNREAGEGIH